MKKTVEKKRRPKAMGGGSIGKYKPKSPRGPQFVWGTNGFKRMRGQRLDVRGGAADEGEKENGALV